jgi:hypothetical protein
MTRWTGKAFLQGRAVLVAAGLALFSLQGCAGGDVIQQYREANEECPPDDLKVPCKIGPDGRLYRY